VYFVRGRYAVAMPVDFRPAVHAGFVCRFRLELSLKFNPAKSVCLAIGKHAHLNPTPMLIGRVLIQGVTFFKYLGVTVVGGKALSFDIAPVKRAFFMSSNCIYAKAKSADELLHLTLQESYSLPVRTYAIAAMKLTMKQQRELNACWNMVYRKLFGFNKWESVKSFVCGVGRLDLHHIIMQRRLQFYFHLRFSKYSILSNVFWLFFCDNQALDVALHDVFLRKCIAVNNIIDHFRLLALC
jgi:hypothetical protein